MCICLIKKHLKILVRLCLVFVFVITSKRPLEHLAGDSGHSERPHIVTHDSYRVPNCGNYYCSTQCRTVHMPREILFLWRSFLSSVASRSRSPKPDDAHSPQRFLKVSYNSRRICIDRNDSMRIVNRQGAALWKELARMKRTFWLRAIGFFWRRELWLQHCSSMGCCCCWDPDWPCSWLVNLRLENLKPPFFKSSVASKFIIVK